MLVLEQVKAGILEISVAVGEMERQRVGEGERREGDKEQEEKRET